MKKQLLFFLLSFGYAVFAQEGVNTFKIKRESNIVKAVFDNNDYKFQAIDKYGNPQDNQIASYVLWIKEKRSTKKFVGYSNSLSPEMLKELKTLKAATKIFFTNIKVKDEEDHLFDLPDVIETWFPDCKVCDR